MARGAHGTTPEADFVYSSWLEAGGEFSVVRDPALRWVRENRTQWNAVFLTKELTKLAFLPIDSILDILVWCHTFAGDEDALWRVSRLSEHLQRKDVRLRQDVLEKFVEVAEIVVRHRLTSDEHLSNPHTSLMLTTLSTRLAALEIYLSRELNQKVEELLVDLLRHPASFTSTDKHVRSAEHPAIVLKIRKLLRKGRIRVATDHDALRRFLRWVNGWHPKALWDLDVIVMNDLKREFPELDVSERNERRELPESQP